MSQVKFKAELRTPKGVIPVEVMGGWDHPMQAFYLTLFDLRPDAPDECVWASDYEPSPLDQRSTVRLRAKLFDFGVQAPEGFWEIIEARERNVITNWTGTMWTGFAAGPFHVDGDPSQAN